MPHDDKKAEVVQEWLDFAHADLMIAQSTLLPGAMYEPVCFMAHQAAEKSIKALLIQLDTIFPYVHDLTVLVDLLPEHYQKDEALENVEDLNKYAVKTRYPSGLERVGESAFNRALEISQGVVEFSENAIRSRS